MRVALDNVQQFRIMLKNAFDDSDKEASASRQLETLRQNNSEFSHYLADFNSIMAVLQYDDTPGRDLAKHEALKKGLAQRCYY